MDTTDCNDSLKKPEVRLDGKISGEATDASLGRNHLEQSWNKRDDLVF